MLPVLPIPPNLMNNVVGVDVQEGALQCKVYVVKQEGPLRLALPRPPPPFVHLGSQQARTVLHFMLHTSYYERYTFHT